MNQIEEIKKQLAVIAKVDAITDEMKLSELGLDSLDVVELLLQLEEQYDIHFDDNKFHLSKEGFADAF